MRDSRRAVLLPRRLLDQSGSNPLVSRERVVVQNPQIQVRRMLEGQLGNSLIRLLLLEGRILFVVAPSHV